MSLPKIPTFTKEPALNPYLRDLTKELERELRQRVPATTGVGAIHLVSPNGSVWRITVSDAGVIATTQVSG